MSSTILGTALPAFVAHAAAGTLYVNNGSSANCSDSGTGTQAQPFCTVQAAADAAQPGQTVLIAPNTTYPEQVTITHSGSPGNPITFKGAGAADVRRVTALVGVYSSTGTYAGRTHAFVFSSGTHDITVTGLKLTAPQEAVLVTDSDHIVVDGNGIQGAGTGTPMVPAIRLTGRTTAATLSRNMIRDSGTAAIAVDGGVAGTVVTTNMVSADSGGIVVTDALGTVVTSNSITTYCHGAITLAGASPNSTVENNVVENGTVTSCPSQAELSVSAGSVSGTKADYNVIQAPRTGGIDYAWGGETAASQAEFTQKSGGQGSHDFTPASVNVFPNSESEATDSADANAPGELSTDIIGNSRVDDPNAANTGTGVGYYDRGAIELQDTLGVTVGAYPDPQSPHPLNGYIRMSVEGAWGPLTATVDFGDGSPKAPVAGGDTNVSHAYPAPGTYTVTVTATDSNVTRTSTSSVTIQPVGPIQTDFRAEQSDRSVPRMTFSGWANSPWPVVKYVLDFGDGSPTSEAAVPWFNGLVHTFPVPGLYTVTQTVIDDHGRSASQQHSVEVEAVLPLNRTIEAVENGWEQGLHEIYSDASGWHDNPVAGVPSNVSMLGFSYSPSGARVIEAVEGAELHEIYSAADGWHDGYLAGLAGNVTAMAFSYSPSGARVIEAVENGQLHEIYSAPDGWHDGVVAEAGYGLSALSVSYSPSGTRVIEAVENGRLHEIYAAADGWHDNMVDGVTGAVSALSFSYSSSGARVIEAVENGSLHEIYSAADGWHDNAVPGAGSNISSLSFKIMPSGDRVIEAIENNMLHEIYTNAGSWYDSITPIGDRNMTAASLALR